MRIPFPLWALCALQVLTSSACGGQSISLSNVAVISNSNWQAEDFSGGVFYVCALDRSHGLAVVDISSGQPAGVAVGDIVDVQGFLQIDPYTNEAWVATYGDIRVEPLARKYISSLFIGTRALGGISGPYQPGVTRPLPLGPCNKGLLVSTAGVVTHVNYFNRFFYVDDGAHLDDGYGPWGVRVSYDYQSDDNPRRLVTPPDLGSFVEVTGISGSEMWQGQTIRTIKLRSVAGVRIVNGAFAAPGVIPAASPMRSPTGARIPLSPQAP